MFRFMLIPQVSVPAAAPPPPPLTCFNFQPLTWHLKQHDRKTTEHVWYNLEGLSIYTFPLTLSFYTTFLYLKCNRSVWTGWLVSLVIFYFTCFLGSKKGGNVKVGCTVAQRGSGTEAFWPHSMAQVLRWMCDWGPAIDWWLSSSERVRSSSPETL